MGEGLRLQVRRLVTTAGTADHPAAPGVSGNVTLRPRRTVVEGGIVLGSVVGAAGAMGTLDGTAEVAEGTLALHLLHQRVRRRTEGLGIWHGPPHDCMEGVSSRPPPEIRRYRIGAFCHIASY